MMMWPNQIQLAGWIFTASNLMLFITILWYLRDKYAPKVFAGKPNTAETVNPKCISSLRHLYDEGAMYRRGTCDYYDVKSWCQEVEAEMREIDIRDADILAFNTIHPEPVQNEMVSDFTGARIWLDKRLECLREIILNYSNQP